MRGTRNIGAYTLMEMVSVITIMSIIGLVTSGVIVESMRVYARTVPAMNVSYQVNLAAERMKREIRDMQDTDSIAAFTATALTFDDSSNNTVAYSLAGGELLRNGDAMARGVTSLVFRFWKDDGTPAVAAGEIHLIEIDLTVQAGTEMQRAQFVAFPRILSPTATGSGSTTPVSPIAHWNLNETSGTIAADSIGSNDGTLINGVTFGVAGAPAGGTAASFDGADDYIEVAHSNDFMLGDGTIQFWFRADDTSSTQPILSKDSPGFRNGGHVLVQLIGDNVEVRLQSDAVSYLLNSGSIVSPGTWHHAAFTFGSSGMNLYVDALSTDTDPYTGGLGTTSGGSGNTEPLVFGSDTWKTGNGVSTPLQSFFEGRIDAVAVFDVALSATDIQFLYDAGGVIN